MSMRGTAAAIAELVMLTGLASLSALSEPTSIARAAAIAA